MDKSWQFRPLCLVRWQWSWNFHWHFLSNNVSIVEWIHSTYALHGYGFLSALQQSYLLKAFLYHSIMLSQKARNARKIIALSFLFRNRVYVAGLNPLYVIKKIHHNNWTSFFNSGHRCILNNKDYIICSTLESNPFLKLHYISVNLYRRKMTKKQNNNWCTKRLKFESL